MHPMRRSVRTHVLDPGTGLVHLTVSYDEKDQVHLARAAGRVNLLGHRTLCDRLEGMWVPRTKPLTCLECVADETNLDPGYVR